MDETITSVKRSNSARSMADVVGCTGSVICALHCLLVPISLIFGPIGQVVVVEEEVFHRVLLWVLLPAAVVAFRIGCLEHKDKWVLVLGMTGLISLTLAFTTLHESLGETAERWVAVLAAVLLIGAHVRNFRLCRSNVCDHESPSHRSC